MPSFARSDSVSYQQSAPWTLAIENDASGNPIYVGRAVPAECLRITQAGTTTPKASAIWQILKLSYDAGGFVSDEQWANGNDKFQSIWNNRASLTYA